MLKKMINQQIDLDMNDSSSFPQTGRIMKITKFLEVETSQISPLNILTLTCGKEIQSAAQFGEIAQKIVESLDHLNELSIDLSRNYSQLKGVIRIVFALGKLQNLQSLNIDLSSNDIRSLNNGHIFSFISKLLNLKSLTMNLQKIIIIDDSAAQNLATCLSDLSELHSLTLNFRKTYLNIFGMKIMFENISLLSQLQNLNINLQLVDNQFIDIVDCLATKLLSNLINLRTLVMHFKTKKYKIFKRQDYVAISSRRQAIFIELFDKYQFNENRSSFKFGIENLSNLEILDLDIEDYLMDNTELNQISQQIENLQQLKELNLCLYLNEIDVFGIGSLEIAFSQLVNLEKLDLKLYNKDLKISDIELLSSVISKLPKLLSLTLCFFQKIYVFQVPPFQLPLISLFTQIQYLNLELINNNIGETEANQLSSEISNLNSLQSLILLLNGCFLRDNGIKIISSGISKLSNLSELFLDLRKNHIYNYGAGYLSIELSKMVQLTHLTLLINHNFVHQTRVLKIFKSIGLLQNLTSLHFSIDDSLLLNDFFANKSTIRFAFQQLTYLNLYLTKDQLELIKCLNIKKLPRLVRFETK